jgi:hypothetical protein
MYAHSFFVTSVRGIGLLPTTSASAGLGVIGFMNAAFAFLAVFFFAVLAIKSPLCRIARGIPRLYSGGKTLEAWAHSVA